MFGYGKEEKEGSDWLLITFSLSHTHTETHTETNEIFVLTCFYTVSMANIAGKYYSNYFFLIEFWHLCFSLLTSYNYNCSWIFLYG